MATTVDRAGDLWREALAIWLAGGWAMWAIAAVAFVLFAMGLHVHLELRRKGFKSVPESVWRGWIDAPSERRGAIGALLDAVLGRSGTRRTTDEDLVARFAQVRAAQAAPFERDLKVMKVCVSAAPLVGLLGTVMGMLTTFRALASGSGGEQTLEMIAKGISEALITTETGLVVALPGLFFQYGLSRSYQEYKAFLAHVETVCTQTMHRRVRLDERAELRREAMRRIASSLFTNGHARGRRPVVRR